MISRTDAHEASTRDTEGRVLRCESENHPKGTARAGCDSCIWTCAYCGKRSCCSCEGCSADDGLDDACDDCWTSMTAMVDVLKGYRWDSEGFDLEDDPDQGKRLHDGCTGWSCAPCGAADRSQREDLR